MNRIFAYCRVSTTEQTTENQVQVIKAAGYDVKLSRIVEEEISGPTPAAKRPKFAALQDKLEEEGQLIVLKIDRLGRSNIDVQTTVDHLLARGVKVISLDLPVPDLTSSTGKMMLQLFSVFTEFERNRIIERTQEGLQRAKSQGVQLGRRSGSKNAARIQQCKREGMTQTEAAALGLGIATIKRHWTGEKHD